MSRDAARRQTAQFVLQRGERPGVMFADWELIGVPHRVVLSDRGIQAGECEYQHRRAEAAEKIPLAGIAAFLRQQLHE